MCSRVAGGEERLEVAGGVRLAGRPAKEREHLEKTFLLFKLKGAWLKSHQVAFLLQVKLDVTSG